MTSVGSGSIIMMLLLLFYSFPPKVNVGTDIVHAIPLTLVAGLGHLGMGSVDFVALVFAVLAFEEASAGIGSAIEASPIGSSSLTILGTRSFTILITTGTIPTAIILTITDTIRTINQATKAVRDTPTLWSDKSNSVWLVQAIIMARSMALAAMQRGGRSAHMSTLTACHRMAGSAKGCSQPWD